MYLARIVVRGFRNFRELDVSVYEGVTCIVGENNSGKSNLLHAIRLAADVNLPNYSRQLTLEDVHGAPDSGGPHHVLVTLEFDGLGEDDAADGLTSEWLIGETRARLTYRFRPSAAIRQKLEDEELDTDQLTLDDYQWELTGGGDFDPLKLKWDERAGTAGIAFGLLQLYRVHFLPALRDVEDDLRYFRRSPLVKLVNQLDLDDEAKQEIVQILETANREICKKDPIKELGESISARQARTAGPAFTQSIALGFAEPTFDSVARSLTPLLSGSGLRSFSVARNGLGLNNVLYVSMLLEFFAKERERKSAAGHLLLCEEPDAHLHPELQMSLMRAIRADSTQALVTTHSTHVAAGAGLGSCLCMTLNADGSSVLTAPAAGSGLSKDDLADLDRYLDATRSRLLFARSVVLVEGVAEMLLIPALARRVLKVDLDSVGVCIVPVHRTHFGAFARLFGEDRLEKRCAIVADGDLAPSEGTDDGLALSDAKNRHASLNSSHVRTFVCRTTFERTLPRPGMLRALQEASKEISKGPGSETAKALQELMSEALAIPQETRAAEAGPIFATAAGLTLKLAEAVGKGRFAQILARHSATLAKAMPPYVADALKWITDAAHA